MEQAKHSTEWSLLIPEEKEKLKAVDTIFGRIHTTVFLDPMTQDDLDIERVVEDAAGMHDLLASVGYSALSAWKRSRCR